MEMAGKYVCRNGGKMQLKYTVSDISEGRFAHCGQIFPQIYAVSMLCRQEADIKLLKVGLVGKWIEKLEWVE